MKHLVTVKAQQPGGKQVRCGSSQHGRIARVDGEVQKITLYSNCRELTVTVPSASALGCASVIGRRRSVIMTLQSLAVAAIM